MSTENRPDPRVVMKVLCAHRKGLEARLEKVVAEKSPWHHNDEFFPNEYDASTARGRTIDSLMRDIDRADDDIMMVDDEIAVSEFWTTDDLVKGYELPVIAAALGVKVEEAA